MRVLNTGGLYSAFRCFDDPSKIPGGYAILSHVWRDKEQCYREIRLVHRQRASHTDYRLGDKIRGCRHLASVCGLPWFWIDAPCIDQQNSVELSEALSSMYCWYAQSTICFAYLHDVPPGEDIRAPGSAFRRSVYFTRGWTLQEVVAPRRVVFLASDWSVLGEKAQLADLLEEITGIDKDVLTLERAVSDVSVAGRLAWASGRQTRRVEDQAYCLMGLFGIHLPMQYGEGMNAFKRLQCAILANICDYTLLAWGSTADVFNLVYSNQDVQNATTGLFAPSPDAFVGASAIVPVDVGDFMARMRGISTSHASLPRFSSDHHGYEYRGPILFRGSDPVAAILACQDEPHSFLALALHTLDSRKPVYGVGCAYTPSSSGCASESRPQVSRLVRVDLGELASRSCASSQRSPALALALTVRFSTVYIANT